MGSDQVLGQYDPESMQNDPEMVQNFAESELDHIFYGSALPGMVQPPLDPESRSILTRDFLKCSLKTED